LQGRQTHDTRAASTKTGSGSIFLSEETFAYQGQAEKIERETKGRGYYSATVIPSSLP
jgi:hypothetical protein